MDHKLIALVCHGNAYLNGRPAPFPVDRVLTERAAFRFKVNDAGGQSGTATREIASSPDEWFAFLARESALGLRLWHMADAGDWLRVSVLDGVSYTVEVLLPAGVSELWVPHSTIESPPEESRSWLPGWLESLLITSEPVAKPRSRFLWLVDRLLELILLPINVVRLVLALIRLWRPVPPLAPAPWRHILHLQARVNAVRHARVDLGGLKDELAQSFRDIHAFAARMEAGPWFLDRFSAAIAILDGRAEPEAARHLAPEHALPPEAVLLLSACAAGWVFGGMSSWNDEPFTPPAEPAEAEKAQREYERVSVRLYAAMMRAIVEATNASCAVH